METYHKCLKKEENVDQFLFAILPWDVFRNIPGDGPFHWQLCEVAQRWHFMLRWGLGRVVNSGLKPTVTFRRQLASGVLLCAFPKLFESVTCVLLPRTMLLSDFFLKYSLLSKRKKS